VNKTFHVTYLEFNNYYRDKVVRLRGPCAALQCADGWRRIDQLALQDIMMAPHNGWANCNALPYTFMGGHGPVSNTLRTAHADDAYRYAVTQKGRSALGGPEVCGGRR
jgi:hypothetical protein